MWWCDAAAFLARAEGISNSDACRRLIDLTGARSTDLGRQQMIRPRPLVVQKQVSALPTPMSDSENQRALAMAAALRDDQSVRERIAKHRNWRPETILELAHEPSLGWDDGKLAFLYESGVKIRWKKESGERVIRWAFGEPWIWRGGYIWQRSTIYVCEGETDCIALIDAGIEKDDSTLAVAVPSASTFNKEWADLFKGKDVILALDGDSAGRQGTEKVSHLLLPVVKSLKQLN